MNKNDKYKDIDWIDVLTDPDNLNWSLNKMMQASGWKTQYQRLYMNKMSVFNQIREELTSGKPYVMQPTKGFNLHENGKLRYIQPLSPKDMLIQHTLTNFVLIPLISRFLIHDNGASIKGKGISFTRKRFEQHMHQFYFHHGLDGFILKIDFRKYFDNIRHDKVIELLKPYVPDERILSIISDILKYYEVDVSYTEDDDLINKVYNSLEYNKIEKSLLTGQRYMPKSLGIGSPVSQIIGIFFPLILDNYCKTVLGLKYYDAYMDDRIIIHHSKEFLKEVLLEIKERGAEIGIFINEKKTIIFPIHKTFSFLKVKYMLTNSGKLIKRMDKSSLKRQENKMKKLAAIIIKDNLDPEIFEQQYKSWRGKKDKEFKAYKQLKDLDNLYLRLSWMLISRLKIETD